MKVISILALCAAAALVTAGAPASADQADYEHAIRTQIVQHVVYPRIARMREEQGTVTYTLTIDPKGQVGDLAVDGSSGNPSLDSAAVGAIKSAAPFPTPPGGRSVIRGTIVYKLDEE